MNHFYKCLLGLCLFLSIDINGFCQAGQAEAGIKAIMEQSKVMGLSVAVVKNNKVIYTHSFGYKNFETKEPLTDDCLFQNSFHFKIILCHIYHAIGRTKEVEPKYRLE